MKLFNQEGLRVILLDTRYSVSLLIRLRSDAGKVTVFCVRQLCARSSLRLSTSKPCCLATQAGSHPVMIRKPYGYAGNIATLQARHTSGPRSPVVGRCQTNRLTSRLVMTQLPAECTLRHELRRDANTPKKESTPDAATQRLSFFERVWINSRERRRANRLPCCLRNA
jgi:hypothetical protein